jgi:hypothetical protein
VVKVDVSVENGVVAHTAYLVITFQYPKLHWPGNVPTDVAKFLSLSEWLRGVENRAVVPKNSAAPFVGWLQRKLLH